MLGPDKLRAVVNMLSDEGSAHVAARVLAREAAERGLLVADLIAQVLGTKASPPPPPPSWHEAGTFHSDDSRGSGKKISAQDYGLQSYVKRQTDKAWLVRSPKGEDMWLPKSECSDQGEDLAGRTIFIIPMWLARKKGLV